MSKKITIFIIFILVAALGVLGYFTYEYFSNKQYIETGKEIEDKNKPGKPGVDDEIEVKKQVELRFEYNPNSLINSLPWFEDPTVKVFLRFQSEFDSFDIEVHRTSLVNGFIYQKITPILDEPFGRIWNHGMIWQELELYRPDVPYFFCTRVWAQTALGLVLYDEFPDAYRSFLEVNSVREINT